MTLCVIDGKQCQCQPDEGTPCDVGTPAQVQAALNLQVMALRKDAERLTWLDTMTKAAVDVLAERGRQQTAEGWTPAHDDKYNNSALAEAAGCYALWGRAYPLKGVCPGAWPWDAHHWKPKTHRENCVRAAALLLAEIERLDRAAGRQSRHSAAAPWIA